MWAEVGSSPRVRGRLDFTASIARDEGLIPASAGQTLDRRGKTGTCRAHPRECGADQLSRFL